MKHVSDYITKVASLLAVTVGCLVLTGWFFDIPFFKSVFPGIASIKFNAVVCFIFSGIALYLLNVPAGLPAGANSRRRKTIAFILAGIILFAGLLTLLEYIFNRNLGIDELLWREGPGTAATIFPGRMSLFTAINFVLLGFIFIALAKRKYYQFIHWLLVAIVSVSLLAIFNYYFVIRSLDNILPLDTISLPSAILFVVVSTGILFHRTLLDTLFSVSKRITGIVLIISLMLAITFLAIHKSRKLDVLADKWLQRTNEEIAGTQKVNTLAREMQSGVRGYLLTGDEDYLPLFSQAADSISIHINRLLVLKKDMADELAEMGTIKNLLDGYINSRKNLVRVRREKGFDAALFIFKNDTGSLLIDKISFQLAGSLQQENKLMREYNNTHGKALKDISSLILLFELFIGLFLLVGAIIVYYYAHSRDRAYALLKKNETRLNDIILSIGDWVWEVDKNGVYTYSSEKGMETLGRTADEIIGKTPFDFMEPDEAKRISAIFSGIIAKRGLIRDLENWIIGKDGKRICMLSNGVPIVDGEGNFEGYRGVDKDITERKQIMEELVLSEKKYKTLFEKASDGILIMNTEGEIIKVNESFAKMHGYTVEEMVQMNLKTIDTPEIAKNLSEKIKIIMAGETLHMDTDHFHKDGHIVSFAISSSLIQVGNEKYIQAFHQDITDRKAAEEKLKRLTAELQASNAELESFASVISHDLKEPLRMVSSFLKLLEEEMGQQLNENSREFIFYAVDGAVRMKKLVDDLLAYSRVGFKNENFVPINLNEIMDYVKRVLQEDIEKNQAIITVKPLPVITADKALFDHLFINLVGNALKYRSDKQPIIEVGCTEEMDNYIFYVKDNGIGIEPRFFEKIFIIFQRLHSRNEYSGSGIGLAVCKKIVEILRGKIWVESEPGKGSTFYFSLPAGQAGISKNNPL